MDFSVSRFVEEESPLIVPRFAPSGATGDGNDDKKDNALSLR